MHCFTLVLSSLSSFSFFVYCVFYVWQPVLAKWTSYNCNISSQYYCTCCLWRVQGSYNCKMLFVAAAFTKQMWMLTYSLSLLELITNLFGFWLMGLYTILVILCSVHKYDMSVFFFLMCYHFMVNKDVHNILYHLVYWQGYCLLNYSAAS